MPDEGKYRHVIRLAEIDAPGKEQAFGNRSRRHLGDPCLGKQAVVKPRTTGRTGQTAARVECDAVDAHAAKVRRLT